MRSYSATPLAVFASIAFGSILYNSLNPAIEESDAQNSARRTAAVSESVTVDGSADSQLALAESVSANCRRGVAMLRSTFTDEVSEGNAQSRLMVLGQNMKKAVFLAEVIGAHGKQITHRWIHDEQEVKAYRDQLSSDRARSWSSHSIGGLTPGKLRVEIWNGDCLIGQKSIEISAVTQIDPAVRTGWMRPQQALETLLARQAKPLSEDRKNPSRINRRNQDGDTPLAAAIRRGDTSEALVLIRAHDLSLVPGSERMSLEQEEKFSKMANPFLRDREGVSPLDLAHRMGQEEIVEALLEVILDPMKGRKRQKHGYVRERWRDSIVSSVQRGADLGQRFGNGDTGLLRAVRLGNELAVFTILDLGAKNPIDRAGIAQQLYAYDANGRQALDIARSEGFYGVERFLRMAMDQYEPKWSLYRATFAASMDGDEPEECRKVGFADEPVLHFFAELTDLQSKQVRHEWYFNNDLVHSETFESMATTWKTQSRRHFSSDDAGMWDVRVVNAKGVVLGARKLHFKAMTPEVEKNRQNYIGTEGCNLGGAAMYALVEAQAPVSKLQYLIDKGASMKPRSKRHHDLFFLAIESGNIPLTRWFLERGVDIDTTVKNGRMPLAIAAEAGDLAMVVFLLANGADINKQRYRGKQTALVIAAIQRNADLTRLLLEHGADPNVLGNSRFAALHTATNSCSGEISALLLEHGADPVAVTRQGETPRSYAARCRKGESWEPGVPGLAPLFVQEASVGVMPENETRSGET